MELDEILNKTCLLGLSYFGTNNELLKQSQLAGKVVNVDEKNGISIELVPSLSGDTIASDKDAKVFVIPPLLTTWFKGPQGSFKDKDGNLLIENPDYLVTWDIYKTQKEKEGDHEWWEWVPRTTPPTVN